MKAITALLCACCAALTAFGQQLTLSGQLMTDDKPPQPIAATRIGAAGFEDTTNRQGRFKLVLPGSFSEGERVIIKVIKPGWLINHPLDGEWNLPNVQRQNIQTLNVIIVPRGSKALWTHARIEKYVAKLSDEIIKLRREGSTLRTIDFSYHLDQWANQFGFTPEQVKAAFDEWSKAVEHSEDYRQLGLRAFYEKNFAAAAANFDKAARKGEEQIKQIGRQLEIKTLETYENWKQAGYSYYILYKFDEAIDRYERAKSVIPKDKYPTEWGEILNLIGLSKQELGVRAVADRGQRLLSEAIEAYQQALLVYTYERFPYEWAVTQNNMSLVLREQALRAEEPEVDHLLIRAVNASRQVLRVTARPYRSSLWANAQNGLGQALLRQAERIEGEEGNHLLAEAADAFRQGLLVFTRRKAPKQWADIQNNLGVTLRELGVRTKGAEGNRLLAEAINAYRQSMLIATRNNLPEDWAQTQNNLGLALRALGKRTSGAKGITLLAEAADALRQALTVRTRDLLPQHWAQTQNNLGVALQSQAERTTGADRKRLLRAAVEAYQLALQERDRRYLPLDWAQTQTNLASAYYALQDWNRAATCYDNVLTLYPDDEESFQRASSLYHEKLFRFSDAFQLRQRWLEINPNDLSVQAVFALNHFTASRFAECRARITALLAQLELPAGTKIALRLIEIANLLSLGQAGEVPAKLDLLSQAVAAQPADFKIEWTFHGTLHFINQAEPLGRYRAWLQQLFGAAAHRDRAAILQALRAAQADFKW